MHRGLREVVDDPLSLLLASQELTSVQVIAKLKARSRKAVEVLNK